jgi:hypothetical protein
MPHIYNLLLPHILNLSWDTRAADRPILKKHRETAAKRGSGLDLRICGQLHFSSSEYLSCWWRHYYDTHKRKSVHLAYLLSHTATEFWKWISLNLQMRDSPTSQIVRIKKTEIIHSITWWLQSLDVTVEYPAYIGLRKLQPKIENPPHTETQNVMATWVFNNQQQWYQLCNINILFITRASYTSTSCVRHVVITECRKLTFYQMVCILLFAKAKKRKRYQFNGLIN